LRQSGLVILILGADYGTKQSTSISATHEEYREAKGTRPVIAFVQGSVTRDADQAAFVKEVEGWEGGLFRGGFENAEKLKAGITRAIHEWQLSTVAAPLNTEQLHQLAINAVSEEQRGGRSGRMSLVLSFSGGPLQPILRPSEIEKPTLANELLQAALFGQSTIFSTDTGNKTSIEGDSLVLQQEERTRMIRLDPQGSIVVRLKIEQGKMGLVVIKEQLERQIVSAIRYAAWVLDKIDPTQRLTHISIAAGFSDANNVVIRTQAEDDANHNRLSMGYGFGNRKNQPVSLKPAHRARAALSHEAENLAEDLVTLLKRDTGN
jgi:hypothetical protein